MKRMLVNATQEEELRVAMVDGQKLYDLDIEVPSREQRKSNVYKGRITRIEPSLEAAFVDYGAQRHGFLPLKEISSEYFVRQPEGGERVQIKDVLKEGQEIVVQVDKEERGTKGAALTTYVSLAGRFLVLMPNNPRAGGVSRRITGEDRDIVRQSLEELAAPESMGCIVRTAGVGRSIEELRWDLEYLLNVWEAIKSVVVSRPAPFLIYQEGNAIVRALRDHFSNDIGEVLIDDENVHKQAHDFAEHVLPNALKKLKYYDDTSVPLFTRFQIESQIESAFARKVSLPSGGSIVIDHTEALTAIDINSARSTKGEDIEETALTTNLEAADEIARQLRIRDLGGLIVVDFIDMGPHRNQRDVENKLREAVRYDRARIQIAKISRFGLLELSRQRLRPSLEESTQSVCPRCDGNGVIRSVESLALAILRLVGEEARKDRTAKVIARLPIELANYVLNEKRDWVQSIQDNNGVAVVLVADPSVETPNYAIKRVRDDELKQPENSATSYKLVEPKEDLTQRYEDMKPPPTPEKAAVSGVLPTTPAPSAAEKPRAAAKASSKASLWQRLFGWLSATEEQSETQAPPQRQRRANERRGSGNRARRSGQGERRNRDRSGGRKDRNGAGGGSANKSKPAKDAKEQQQQSDQSGQASQGGQQSRSSRGRRSRGRRSGSRSSQTEQSSAQNNKTTQQTDKPQTDERQADEQQPSRQPDERQPSRQPDERQPARQTDERAAEQADRRPAEAAAAETAPAEKPAPRTSDAAEPSGQRPPERTGDSKAAPSGESAPPRPNGAERHGGNAAEAPRAADDDRFRAAGGDAPSN
jgi:ribonuclease E